MEPIVTLLEAFRRIPTIRGRTAKLQEYIGEPSDDLALLHGRALLVTALREAYLWPSDVKHTANP